MIQLVPSAITGAILSPKLSKTAKYAFRTIGLAVILPGSGVENLSSSIGFDIGFFLLGKNRSFMSRMLLGGISFAVARGSVSTFITEGIHPGSEGMGAEAVRQHSEFGSGWDPLRKMATKIYGSAEGSFAKMIKSQEFRRALSSAEEVELLGFGASGTAKLMRGKFAGQEFKFVRKSGAIWGEEAMAMRAVQGSVGPSVYSSSSNVLEMEYFAGKALGDLSVEQLKELPGIKEKVSSAFGALHKAGFRHGDPHLGNVVLTETPEGVKKIGLIDFGAAKNLSRYESKSLAAEAIKTDLDVALGALETKRTGSLSFTPAFMSEAVGKAKNVEPEDLFSFLDDSIKRNERFRERSKEAVGIGLRQAHNAGRRHGKFASNKGM